MHRLYYILLMLLSIDTSAFSNSIVEIKSAWIRHTSDTAHVTAAYAKISNLTGKDIYLEKVEAPSLSSRVELHFTELLDGVYRMQKQDRLLIKAKSTLELKPKSYHIMIMQLKKPLKEASREKLTFYFSDQTKITVEAAILPSSINTKLGSKFHNHLTPKDPGTPK